MLQVVISEYEAVALAILSKLCRNYTCIMLNFNSLHVFHQHYGITTQLRLPMQLQWQQQ